MKWLREFSTSYISGVGFDNQSVSFQYQDISWEEEYFTIFPLSDGNLTITAYAKSSSGGGGAGIFWNPVDNIVVSWRLKGSTTWTDLSFTKTIEDGSGISLTEGYVSRTISLNAGLPVELKCLTGLTRSKNSTSSSQIFPGNIKTDCPTIIMGQLQSLIVGGVNIQGTSGDPTSSVTIPWQSYLDGLRELFKGWNTLLDATNLVMPKIYYSSTTFPNYTELFSGCIGLISAPRIIAAGNYTRCFENCDSLRSIYANISPSSRNIYTLTDWLEGTNLGNRRLYIPDTLDPSYDLCLENNWTTETFEF